MRVAEERPSVLYFEREAGGSAALLEAVNIVDLWLCLWVSFGCLETDSEAKE